MLELVGLLNPHWALVFRYTGAWARGITYDGVTAYDVIGGVCIVGSIILIAAAARDLGKAYDRCGGEENVRQAVVESSSHAGNYL